MTSEKILAAERPRPVWEQSPSVTEKGPEPGPISEGHTVTPPTRDLMFEKGDDLIEAAPHEGKTLLLTVSGPQQHPGLPSSAPKRGRLSIIGKLWQDAGAPLPHPCCIARVDQGAWEVVTTDNHPTDLAQICKPIMYQANFGSRCISDGRVILQWHVDDVHRIPTDTLRVHEQLVAPTLASAANFITRVYVKVVAAPRPFGPGNDPAILRDGYGSIVAASEGLIHVRIDARVLRTQVHPFINVVVRDIPRQALGPPKAVVLLQVVVAVDSDSGYGSETSTGSVLSKN